mmetsp:Transcript_20598/g.22873  ORF Transcript_20598/g.22873 Transcript_20598/m.22873 type:complete len:125 (-) Transcript_20598:182-556(-)|eukprot:CAMPEP_0168522586 /NCGR_PEP_ID=MMETSP0405-20121227/9433_1 /TAXON_ID=498012 /ORGANISM="Trichosphaerium sp, Strain Am-I-7 wt" /LENGTH=124 /DNA_ID=CAMNT_0008544211 /DNA_START=36 /DNA_END=410 /DNA_ORIENTATION=+
MEFIAETQINWISKIKTKRKKFLEYSVSMYTLDYNLTVGDAFQSIKDELGKKIEEERGMEAAYPVLAMTPLALFKLHTADGPVYVEERDRFACLTDDEVITIEVLFSIENMLLPMRRRRQCNIL